MKCYGVRVPVKEITAFQKRAGDNLLLLKKVKCVQEIENDKEHKKVLIKQKNEDLEKFIEEYKYSISEEKVTLTYDNMTMNEVLRQILPPEIGDIPSGFETVGDIAHMNLTGKLLDYRYQIGEVVLDKNPALRSVVTKLGQIESTYRFYDLECIAGDSENYETIQIEDKVRFKVDISKVYWCSKLGSERNRMIEKILKEGDVLCDMFCGIGPLAVKAAVKKKIKVVANDLNPSCYDYLK